MPSLRRSLLAVAVLLFAATAGLFAIIMMYEERLRSAASEDAMWVAYQLDRETLRLRAELAALLADPTDRRKMDDVSLRFDILYSRLELLTRGEVADIYRSRGSIADDALALRQHILSMDHLFQAALQGDQQAMLAFSRDVETLRSQTERFVLTNNQARAGDLTSQRDELRFLYSWLGGLILFLSAVLGSILLIQLRQNRALAEANLKLEQTGLDLARAALEAKAASRAKSEFLATMSHEIRTPMNAVLGMTELLQETPLDERQRAQLGKISSAGHALLQLINEILDMSAIEAGRLTLNPQATRVKGLLSDLADLLWPTAHAKSLDLQVIADPSLPQHALLDCGRVRQILVNLVGNAVKFTERGKVELRARLEAGDTDRPMLRFEIRDTGIGLPEGARDRLFEHFSTIETGAARRHAGTGLGLAISRRLVELMGGRIDFTSTLGEGSCFWFDIPYHPADGETVQAAQTIGPAGMPIPAPVVRLKVLLVEDNALNRDVAQGYLALLGHDVAVASSGQEALIMSAQHRYDVILMDVRMPGMDGLEATRRLRAMPDYRAGMPIIALTANILAEDHQECLNAGMTAVLPKPVSRDMLRRALASVMPVASGIPDGPDPQHAQAYQSRLLELRDALGEDGLRTVKQAFLREVRDRLERLEAARAEGNWDMVSHEAHSLKGMALDFDLAAMAACAAEIEQASHGAIEEPNGSVMIAARIKQLETHVRDASAMMREDAPS